MDGSMADIMPEVTKNPLVCPICQDYFVEPCLMQCYHTFCGRCLRGRDQDGRISCPLCGSVVVASLMQAREFLTSVDCCFRRQFTPLKDGSVLPPQDNLMRQLLEISNSENPPCANCDKRDRSNMHYCNTCGAFSILLCFRCCVFVWFHGFFVVGKVCLFCFIDFLTRISRVSVVATFYRY